VAVEYVELAVVPREGFLDFLPTEQLARLHVLTLLCDQLHIAQERVRWVASLSSGNACTPQPTILNGIAGQLIKLR
jgi:hypothetical protein